MSLLSTPLLVPKRLIVSATQYGVCPSSARMLSTCAVSACKDLASVGIGMLDAAPGGEMTFGQFKPPPLFRQPVRPCQSSGFPPPGGHHYLWSPILCLGFFGCLQACWSKAQRLAGDCGHCSSSLRVWHLEINDPHPHPRSHRCAIQSSASSPSSSTHITISISLPFCASAQCTNPPLPLAPSSASVLDSTRLEFELESRLHLTFDRLLPLRPVSSSPIPLSTRLDPLRHQAVCPP